MGDTEPKHLTFGTPISEWIDLVGELHIDAVGFWQIVSVGRRGFGLKVPALDDFVRRRLIALFTYGAFPVRHVPGDPNVWTIQTSYGDLPEAMAESVINEWVEQGRADPGLGGLWFATPNIANHPFTASHIKGA